MLYIILGVILFTYFINTGLSILNYKNRKAELPQEVNDIYNEEEYKRWLDYTMEGFRFTLIVRTVSLVITLILFAFGVFASFQDLASLITSSPYWQTGLFFFFYYIIIFILGTITSYHHKFVIEEKYGFNKSTKATFVKDRIKSLILTIIFAGSLLIGLFALYTEFHDQIIYFLLFGWVGLVIIILVVNMIYVKVIVPIFNKLTPLEEGKLKEEINAFAESVGYTVSKISVMDASRRSSKLNAFFSGFGKFKQIVLFDTLIEKMSTEEIVAVLAHEIGHNKHKHIIQNLFQTIIQLALYFGILMAVLSTKEFSTAFGFNEVHFGFSIILFAELLAVIDFIIALVLNGLSRKAEYQADRYAATKYKKEPMITALKVLSRENFSNLTPHPLFVKIRYSHPPVFERIRAINNI